MLTGLQKEVKYRTSRSSGPGGQHVNKVATKVELLFDVNNSTILTENEKETISLKLKNKISQEGILSVQCESSRSQLKNKELAFNKLLKLLNEALTINKVRKPSKPKKGAILKRLSDKKRHSEKKSNRRFKEE